MTEIECSDLGNICRFCGCKKNFGKDLYGPESSRLGLITKVNEHFPPEVISLEENDGLPKFICSQCELTINYFSKFRAMVKRVQQSFKQVMLEKRDLCHSSRTLDSSGIITICLASDNITTCQSCQEVLDTSYLQSLVSLAETNGKIYCCCIRCGRKDELRTFFNIKDNGFRCPRCIFELNKNGGETSSAKKFQCEICDKHFRSRGHLNRHKLIHIGKKPYLCETCGAEFNQKSSLKTHSYIHKQINPFTCNWCYQTFRHKTSLQLHLINFHGLISDNYYECHQCRKQFVNKAKLKRHYRSHSGEQPFKCDICGKRFSQNNNLKTHSKKHENEVQIHNTDFYTSENLMVNDTIKYSDIFNKCLTLTFDEIHIENCSFDEKIDNSCFSVKAQDDCFSNEVRSDSLDNSKLDSEISNGCYNNKVSNGCLNTELQGNCFENKITSECFHSKVLDTTIQNNYTSDLIVTEASSSKSPSTTDIFFHSTSSTTYAAFPNYSSIFNVEG